MPWHLTNNVFRPRQMATGYFLGSKSTFGGGICHFWHETCFLAKSLGRGLTSEIRGSDKTWTPTVPTIKWNLVLGLRNIIHLKQVPKIPFTSVKYSMLVYPDQWVIFPVWTGKTFPVSGSLDACREKWVEFSKLISIPLFPFWSGERTTEHGNDPPSLSSFLLRWSESSIRYQRPVSISSASL